MTERLSDTERVEVLRETHDALALGHAALEAMGSVMWRSAVFFYETGTPVEDVCAALDVSPSTFFRRLREIRGDG